MVNLLLDRWYEPADPGNLHLSTLIQQLLSTVAQHGGVTAIDAYLALCDSGPFKGVTTVHFASLLRHLGSIDVLTQSPDNLLLLAAAGERLVNHHSFYVAFVTREEWRLVSDEKTLGSLPISYPLRTDQFLIFAGRRWRVASVDAEHKVISLVPAPGGRPPRFQGAGIQVHGRVRREMLSVYQSSTMPRYLDSPASKLLIEARQNFARFRLAERQLLQSGEDTYVFLWAGHRVTNTVMALLGRYGLDVTPDGIALAVRNTSPLDLAAQIVTVLAAPRPEPLDLSTGVPNKLTEKFEPFLPLDLLDTSYATRSFDVQATWMALQDVVASTVAPRPGQSIQDPG
jgi:ATP-dependent Lhr-like helicase